MQYSICLTIHNKEALIERVLKGIIENTIGDYELIICLDGCEDQTEEILTEYLFVNQQFSKKLIILTQNNVFETRANNACAFLAKGKYIIFVQDDCIITEPGWNDRLVKPMETWPDEIFAVTGRCAHNYKFNPTSQDINMAYVRTDGWCDILEHIDHANSGNTPRNVFAIRDTVNRGPLAINRADFENMGRFSVHIFKQDMDDHLLMYDMQIAIGKKVGYYGINFESKDEWGGTRENGQPKAWLLEANNVNTRLLYKKHSETIKRCLIENRILE